MSEGLSKCAINQGVIYRIWFAAIYAITICVDPISKEFFLRDDNPMNEFELKFF